MRVTGSRYRFRRDDNSLVRHAVTFQHFTSPISVIPGNETSRERRDFVEKLEDSSSDSRVRRIPGLDHRECGRLAKGHPRFWTSIPESLLGMSVWIARVCSEENGGLQRDKIIRIALSIYYYRARVILFEI